MTLIRFYPILKVGGNGWEPDVDILETKDDLVISAELPGLKKEDLSLTLEDHTLTLRGEKKRKPADEDEDYQLNERTFGKFCRSFTMPDAADLEKIRSSFKDGLLRVSIPKSQPAKQKEIKVEFK
jgi:HSP20 family protein